MKKVVIIDDSPVIRLVLSSIFSRYLSESQIKTFTSADGVQGLGYIFITRPDLVIVDLTLPKYSGMEVVDFLSTNEHILEEKIPVIVLTEDQEQEKDLPDHFVHLNKESKNFVDEIIEKSLMLLGLKVDIKNGFRERFFRGLAGRLIYKTNKVDELNERKVSKGKFKKSILGLYSFLLQLKLSVYISLFFLFFNRADNEENIELQKKDLAKFRVKTYSAVGIALASLFVVFLQVVLLSGGLFSAFIFGNKAVQAASYTWDGEGDDITCGGAVGDGNKWSCALNWSLDIVPTSADTVTFNGTSTKDAVVDAGFGGVVTSVNIASGYTGTITQQRSFQTTSTFTQADGIYTASNQTLDVDSTFTLSAGSFTASSGNTFIGGALAISGAPTFNANSGIMIFDGGTNTLSCNNVIFNLVTFTHTGTKTINSNCTLPIGNDPNLSTTGSITLSGTLSGSGTFTKSSATGLITLNTGGTLSGFSGFSSSSSSSLTIAGATVDFSAYTTFLAAGTVTLSSGALTLPNGTDLNGALTISGGTFNAPSGNMAVAGNMTVSGAGVFTANGGTVTFDGTAFSSANCNGMSFSNVVVAATGTASKGFNNCPSIPVGNNPSLTRITLQNSTLSGTGTLTLAGGGDSGFIAGAAITGFTGIVAQGFTINGANLNLSSLSSFTQGPAGNTLSLSSGSLQLPNGADINGNLTISGGTFTAPSGTMTLAANLTISGSPTFNANGGTINFDSALGGTYSCNNVTFNLVTFTHTTGTKVVNSNCNLPLGNNPTIGTANSLTGLTNNGILTGTGTLNLGVFNFNTGSSLSGFSGITANSTFTVAGGTANLSGYTSFTSTASAPVVLSSGSLSLPSGADLNLSLAISGGTFNAPSGTMTLAGNLTVSGAPIFNANGGTFTFDGSGGTLTCSNVVFNSVILNHVATTVKTINNGCNLPLGNNPSVSGGVFLHGTLSGTGIITLAGSGATTLNATGGFSGFNGVTTIAGGFTVAGATANFGGYSTFTAGNAVTLSSGTLTLPSGTDLNSTLTISGGTFNAPSGTMSLSGALTITGTPVFNANGGTFNFDGTSDATLSCNNVIFNLVTFTHTGAGTKVISSNCTIPVGNNPTVTGRIRINAATATLTGSGLFTSTCENSNCLRVTSGNFTGFSGLIAQGGISADGGNLNLGSYSPVTIYGRNASSSISISSGGVFTAPSGTMLLYDKINNVGTFNHNNGTVEFSTEEDDKGIGLSTGTVTFNNLKATVTIPSDFSFISGTTTTVLGTFEMKGTSGNLLSLMTDTPGVQWNLDVSNATSIDLEYLNVTDSNSINRIIQTAGLNVTDGGNNTNWNFANPEISEVGPTNLIDGSYITDNKPTFEFKILDPDSANQIKYVLTIDNNSDFSSPEIEEISAFVDQGELTFTPTTALEDGEYYWKLESEDSQQGLAEVFLANEGEVAFVLDNTKPEGSVVIAEVDEEDPFKAMLIISATDNLSGVDQMMISQRSDFLGATYEPFNTTKEIEFSHTNGAKGVYVRVKDRAGNESDVFGASIIIFVQNNPASEEEPEETPDLPVEGELQLYTLQVKVVGKKNKPIENVKVELSSNEGGEKTNKEGIVTFEEVEEGTHKLIIEYKGKRIENEVTITGEDETIVIKIILEESQNSTWIYVSCLFIIIIVLILLIILLMRRRREQKAENIKIENIERTEDK